MREWSRVLIPASVLMWICGTRCEHLAEEVEIFHSDTQSRLGWSSEPRRMWTELRISVGGASVPVLQACGGSKKRTVFSPWIGRDDARHILMDIAFAQEEEAEDLSPLQVHLVESNAPMRTFTGSRAVLDLKTTTTFPATAVTTAMMINHMDRRASLKLGSLHGRGFHLGFSYSGRCVLVVSIRLYYRRCPELTADLTRFGRAGAGSGPVAGSCVVGAVAVSTPVRDCGVDGLWGPQQGGCTCRPGHQTRNHTCEACRMGHYKPANHSGACLPCPTNSGTDGEGSERCDCRPGFSRLETDPLHLGCSRPPSAPVNLTAHNLGPSLIILTWEPPHDLGGRRELTYRVTCQEEVKEEDRVRWESCRDSEEKWTDNRTVSISGLSPQNDYRLSVQAWNAISNQRGAPPSSTATVTIHRWKVPPETPPLTPAVTPPETPGPQVSEEEKVPAGSHHLGRVSTLIVCVLIAGLLLITIVLITVGVMRRKYKKLRCEQEVELLPINNGITYRRQQEPEAPPPQDNAAAAVAMVDDGVLQLLEDIRISGRLLDSLKDVLVERNQLTLGKELGKGEFGSVYEGVFTTDGGVHIKVAVKTMRVGIHSQDDLHGFLSEADIMKNFDHDNVVRLLGVTLQREQDAALPVPMVVLPYMKHGDLRRFLIATRYGDIPMFVPHQSLLRFMVDISAGMDYLSSRGFLHRDLAARNCMLGDDLRVCVADFGLSKKIYSSNYYRQKVAIRVPIKWMSMESLSDSVYTTKSDVWSFGVTMWEIVSRGRTPYPGVQNHELLDLLLSGVRLRPPQDCDHQLYEVMQSCWHQDPARRPGFGELVQTLKGLLSQLPVMEASQEAHYINQGLEAAYNQDQDQDLDQDSHQTQSGGRWENVYLPSPVGAAAGREEDVELEDGYVKSAVGHEQKL